MQQKPILKNATGIDTSKLALKSNLASQETEVDKLDVDQLKIVSVDLNKLSKVMNNDFVKNCSR